MTEFNSENLPDDDDLKGIVEGLLERQGEIEKTKQELEDISHELRKLDALRAELVQKRSNLSNKLTQDKWDLRKAERERDAAMRAREMEKEKARLRQEFEEKTKYLDELTAGAPWREFAFDHQVQGAKILGVAKRGILADKRGLGKTLTGICWLDMVQSRKSLVIAPNDVVSQFEEEIAHWAPHRKIISASGMKPEVRATMFKVLKMLPEGFVMTLNYEAWRKDKAFVDQLVDIGFDTVICDEAHRAKSSTKLTARGIFKVIHAKNYCPNCNTINHEPPWQALNMDGTPKRNNKGVLVMNDADPFFPSRCETCQELLQPTVKHVLPMTGTPILNKPQEMFSMLYMCYPRMFPSEKAFLNDFCEQIAPNRWKFKYGGADRLTEKMKEFYLARTREDAGIKVPPPAIIHHFIEMDTLKYGYPEQFKAYKELNEAAALVLRKGIEGKADKGEAFLMNCILQIINHSRQMQSWPPGINIRDPETKEILGSFDVEESCKLDAVEALCREFLEEGERAIIWSKFKKPLYELQRRLGDRACLATGDQPKYLREQIRREFDLKTAPENPRWDLCFSTYEAFGTGTNLNAAKQMITLDDEWNAAMQDQAFGRIDRMNNEFQATIHIFRVKGTIDTFMEKLIEFKRSLSAGFETSMGMAQEMLKAIQNGEM